MKKVTAFLLGFVCCLSAGVWAEEPNSVAFLDELAAAENCATLAVPAEFTDNFSVSGKAVYLTGIEENDIRRVDCECHVLTKKSGILVGDVLSVIAEVKSLGGTTFNVSGQTMFKMHKGYKVLEDIEFPVNVNTDTSLYFNSQYCGDEEVVLDLNGHTLSQAIGIGGGYWYSRIHVDCATVRVIDSSEEKTGKVTGIGSCLTVTGYKDYTDDDYPEPTNLPGKLTIDAGLYTLTGGPTGSRTSGPYYAPNGLAAVFYAGELVINGGTFDAASELNLEGKCASVIGAGRSMNKPEWGMPSITINGGKFVAVPLDHLCDTRDPGVPQSEDGLFSGNATNADYVAINGGAFSVEPPKAMIAEGLELELVDGEYAVKAFPKGSVAKVIGETDASYFTTINEAIAAWDAGETLKLLADVTYAGTTTITFGTGTYTLDTNGKTFDWTARYSIGLTIPSSSQVKVVGGGTIAFNSSSSAKDVYLTGGKFTLDGAEMVVGKSSAYGIYVNTNGSSIELNDATVTINSTYTSPLYGIYCSSRTFSGSIDNTAIVATVAVRSSKTYAVYYRPSNKTDTLTISGGTIDLSAVPEAKTTIGIYVTKGNLDIDTFVKANGNVSSIAVDESSNSSEYVTITGGTYIGAINSQNKVLKINGGSFSVKPAAENMVEGYIVAKNEGTGLYYVTEGEYVVSANDVPYVSVEEMNSNLPDLALVKVLKSNTAVTIPQGKTVTLANAADIVIGDVVNNGTLEITDATVLAGNVTNNGTIKTINAKTDGTGIGKFSEAAKGVFEDCIGKGSFFVLEEDGYYTIKRYVADVDGVKFTSAKDAFEAASNSQNALITILCDIDLGTVASNSDTLRLTGCVARQVTQEDKNTYKLNFTGNTLFYKGETVNATLDLNGKTISSIVSTGTSQIVRIECGAKLTIKDSSEEGSGKIVATSESDYVGGAAVATHGGSLVIESGTIVGNALGSNDEAVALNNASAYPYSELREGVTSTEVMYGSFKMTGGTIISASNGITFNVPGGEYEISGGTITTTGSGKFGAVWVLGSASVTIFNATINAPNACGINVGRGGTPKAVIQDGTIVNAKYVFALDDFIGSGCYGTLLVEGGEFNVATGGTLFNNSTAANKDTPNVIELSGGYYSVDPVKLYRDYIAVGGVSSEYIPGTQWVLERIPVAKIDETLYYTYADAVQAANKEITSVDDFTTIKLLVQPTEANKFAVPAGMAALVDWSEISTTLIHDNTLYTKSYDVQAVHRLGQETLGGKNNKPIDFVGDLQLLAKWGYKCRTKLGYKHYSNMFLYKDLTLTEDVEMANYVGVHSAINIIGEVLVDLNGHTLKHQGFGATGSDAHGPQDMAVLDVQSGVLTVKDSSAAKTGMINANMQAICVREGGEFILEGGTITAQGAYYKKSPYISVCVDVSGKFTMKGGCVSWIGRNQLIGPEYDVLIVTRGTAKADIQGGTLEPIPYDMQITGNKSKSESRNYWPSPYNQANVPGIYRSYDTPNGENVTIANEVVIRRPLAKVGAYSTYKTYPKYVKGEYFYEWNEAVTAAKAGFADGLTLFPIRHEDGTYDFTTEVVDAGFVEAEDIRVSDDMCTWKIGAMVVDAEGITKASRSSLAKAVEAAVPGDTVKLLKMVVGNVMIPVGVTIAKNGQIVVDEFTSPEGYIVVNDKLAETWTVAKVFVPGEGSIEAQVKPEDGETAAEMAPIKVTEAWVEANVEPVGETATVEEINKALNKQQKNGNLAWQNYILGIDPTKPLVADATHVDDVVEVTILDDATMPSDTGFTISYAIVHKNAAGDTNELDYLDIPLTKDEDADFDPTGIYQVKVIITHDDETKATVEIPTENKIGVVKATQEMELAIIAVPWKQIAAEDSDITVDDLVHKEMLDVDDTIYVYKTDGGYISWTLEADANGNKVWGAMQVVDARGARTSGHAGDHTVQRGAGVFLKRQNHSKPYYLYGQYSDEEVVTELDEPMNLVANPNIVEFDLNAEGAIESQEGDNIVIPTVGAPKICEKDANGWFYVDWVKGDNGIMQMNKVRTVTIPAGTGFWYQKNAEGNAKIHWSK